MPSPSAKSGPFYRLTVTDPEGTETVKETSLTGMSDEVYALGCGLGSMPPGMKATIERIF